MAVHEVCDLTETHSILVNYPDHHEETLAEYSWRGDSDTQLIFNAAKVNADPSRVRRHIEQFLKDVDARVTEMKLLTDAQSVILKSNAWRSS